MKKLSLNEIIDYTLKFGFFQPDYTDFVRNREYGSAFFTTINGHWYASEFTEKTYTSVQRYIYLTELTLMSMDVKDAFKDLSPLEELPFDRIKSHEPTEQVLDIIFRRAAGLLNSIVIICSYDSLIKALYAETQLEPLKKLFIPVTTDPKKRNSFNMVDSYKLDNFPINNLEDALIFFTAQIDELKKRTGAKFPMFNYKGYIATKGVIEAVRKDLNKDNLDYIVPSYADHIRKRYTKDSGHYMSRYGFRQWQDYCVRA